MDLENGARMILSYFLLRLHVRRFESVGLFVVVFEFVDICFFVQVGLLATRGDTLRRFLAHLTDLFSTTRFFSWLVDLFVHRCWFILSQRMPEKLLEIYWPTISLSGGNSLIKIVRKLT